MLASSIRIYRLVKGNVGRVVGANDRTRMLGLERRSDAVGCVLEVPAVIHRLELLKIEAPGRIRERSPAGEGVPACDRAAHCVTVYIYRSPVKPPAASAKTPRRQVLNAHSCPPVARYQTSLGLA